MIEKWLSENLNDSVIGSNGGELSITGIAGYQPFDGLMELKVVKLTPLFISNEEKKRL